MLCHAAPFGAATNESHERSIGNTKSVDSQLNDVLAVEAALSARRRDLERFAVDACAVIEFEVQWSTRSSRTNKSYASR